MKENNNEKSETKIIIIYITVYLSAPCIRELCATAVMGSGRGHAAKKKNTVNDQLKRKCLIFNCTLLFLYMLHQ